MRLRTFRPLVSIIAVLATGTSAQAASVVIMAVNNAPGIAGATAYDFGVQITSADVANAGADPVLFVQNLSFVGTSTGPIQAAGSNNVDSIQTAWNTLDMSNGGGGPSFPAIGAAATQLYADSWWDSSNTGTLQGINNSARGRGIVTTVPAADGSGVYAQGPGALVGTTGYLFQPIATGITGGINNNSTMGFTGVFGPLGLDYLDPSPGGPFTDPTHILGDLLVANGGTLTVPLAQVIASGNIGMPSPGGGAGTFLEVGSPPGTGDANHDGIVNGLDLVLTEANWLTTNPNKNGPGDVNGDGIVNGEDISVIATHWLTVTGPGAAPNAGLGNSGPLYNVLGGPQNIDPGAYLNFATNTIAPEPSTLALAALAALTLVAFRRRR